MERFIEVLAGDARGIEIVATKLREEEGRAKVLRAELAEAEAATRSPVHLPTPTTCCAS